MAKDSMKVREGFATLTPVLSVSDAIAAIRFYEKVFDARVLERHDEVGGKVSNAALAIGDSSLMLSDEFSEHSRQHAGEGWPKSPKSLGGSSASLYLYVADADAVLARAVAEGARTIRPATDRPWGDRIASFEDPSGCVWTVATHLRR
jgi:PhnB protein